MEHLPCLANYSGSVLDKIARSHDFVAYIHTGTILGLLPKVQSLPLLNSRKMSCLLNFPNPKFLFEMEQLPFLTNMLYTFISDNRLLSWIYCMDL
jgi:hypothetical protein